MVNYIITLNLLFKVLDKVYNIAILDINSETILPITICKIGTQLMWSGGRQLPKRTTDYELVYRFDDVTTRHRGSL